VSLIIVTYWVFDCLIGCLIGVFDCNCLVLLGGWQWFIMNGVLLGC
jgi:hypothetical protein